MSEFTDDFDYPGGRLGEHGWTVTNGTFDTANSALVGDSGPQEYGQIAHEQPNAFGTFEVRGVKNEADSDLRIFFASDGPSTDEMTWGYGIAFKADGTVTFAFVEDGQYGELPIPLARDHGGTAHDVRVERDPERERFRVFFDGQRTGDPFRVGGVNLKEPSHWTMAYGGQRGSQRIDGVHWSGPGGRTGVRITDVRAVQTVENTRIPRQGNGDVDDSDVSTPIPDPPLVADRKTAVVFDVEPAGGTGDQEGDPDLKGLAPDSTVELRVEAGGVTETASLSAVSLLQASKSGSVLAQFANEATVPVVDGGRYLSGQNLAPNAAPNETLTVEKVGEGWSRQVTATPGGLVVFGGWRASESYGTELDGPGEYTVSGRETSLSFTLDTMPTFDLPADADSIALTLSAGSQEYTTTLGRGSEFDVVEMPTLTVGVVPLEGAYGTIGQNSDYDSRREAYWSEVKRELEYLQRTYPTPRVDAFVVDVEYAVQHPNKGTLGLYNELHDGKDVRAWLYLYAHELHLSSRDPDFDGLPSDFARFVTVADGELRTREEFDPQVAEGSLANDEFGPADHFTIDTSSGDPFDVAFGVVPNGSLANGNAGTHFSTAGPGWPRHSGDPIVQPRAAPLITVDRRNRTTAAHEAGHHFVGGCYDEGRLWLDREFDGRYASNDPDDENDVHVNGDVRSTKFDLEGGSFDVQANAQSYMRPSSSGSEWIDAFTYTVMAERRLTPNPPEEV